MQRKPDKNQKTSSAEGAQISQLSKGVFAMALAVGSSYKRCCRVKDQQWKVTSQRQHKLRMPWKDERESVGFPLVVYVERHHFVE